MRVKRLRTVKFVGLYFSWGRPPDESVTVMFPKHFRVGWHSTQMSEIIFLGYCYLDWSM